jgi:putative transposase
LHSLVRSVSFSYRHLEEIMQERGVAVDHSSINRWAIRFLPLAGKGFPEPQAPSRYQLENG